MTLLIQLKDYISRNVKTINLITIIDHASQIKISLNATKGGRTSSSIQTINLVPKDVPLSPIVSKLAIIPNKQGLNRRELLVIQTDVVPNDCRMEWLMDGENIPNILTTIINSPSLAIDTTALKEGSMHHFKLTVVHPLTNESSSFEHSISINIPPYCECSFSPSLGIALETDFSYGCENCRDENILNFGFIDENTGSLIPLSADNEIFSFKIPAPNSGNIVQVYSEVINLKTGSRFMKNQNLTIDILKYETMEEVDKKHKSWITYASCYLQTIFHHLFTIQHPYQVQFL